MPLELGKLGESGQILMTLNGSSRYYFCLATSISLLLSVWFWGFDKVIASNKSKTAISSLITSIPKLSTENSSDGQEFIQKMAEAAKHLLAYSFQYEMTVFKNRKIVQEQGNFFFKQPGLIRIEETGDYKHGAVAILDKGGKARGHLGGILSPFILTVGLSSNLLNSANGYPLINSDFAAITKVVQGYLKQGMKSLVTKVPVNVEGHPGVVHILEIYKEEPNNKEIYKRAYIDPQSLLPLQWFDYVNGKLYARTIWKNFRPIDIKDSYFRI